MKKTHKIRYILLVCAFDRPDFTAVCPALAALAKKTIDVYTGVNIYVDDVKLEPKDANGNPVEVFVYNGTTYLPVRAVGEAYGKVVQWDGSTQTVYLGTHSSTTPAVWLKDLDYFTGKSYVAHSADKDNLGNVYSESFSTEYGDPTDNIYKLNGQYSKMTGTFYQRYDYRSNTSTNTMQIYGDGKLLFDGSVSSGVEPVFFDVDLTGVLELRVKTGYWRNGGLDFTPRAAIGNCGLYS
jgi:hypothetical protein